MKKITSLFIAVLLSACSDEVVNTETQTLSEQEAIVNCTYSKPGICTDCGIGYDGKMSCTLKFKPFCRHHGAQRAIVRKAKVVETYASGDTHEYIESRVVEKLSQCQ